MSLLGKIRKYNSAAAKELENANFRTDSEIKSLDRTDLYELFPEKKNLKLRKDINEIIHPKRPVEDLVRELKGFIPHESACAAKSSDPSGPATFSNCQTGHIPPETRGADLDSDKNGVISPDLGNQLRHPREDSQGFSKSEKRKEEAGGGEVLCCLESSRCTSAGDFDGTDCFSGAKTTDPSGPVTFSSPQIGHIPPGTPAGNSSDLLPSVLREVKYNMIVDGQTLNAHQQLMNELLSQQQVQDCQFSESSDDHQVTLLFKPISSHMESDVEAAMSRIKDNKPVILVLMHHFYEPKSTSSPRILKDYPNVVLAVHVFFHDTKSGLLTCRENSAAISSIRDKLLEYSTLVIPGENLQGVSERRNLEAEGGEVLRCPESSRCTSAGDFDCFSGAKTTDPSGPVTFSSPQIGHIPPGTPAGNSSDLLPSVLREVKYNMIVDGQTLNAHQQLMNELLSQQQAQDCQFSESSDDHQVTFLFKQHQFTHEVRHQSSHESD
ncbi:uncharacterized protein LOC130515921 isoform X15 [Takifugu flavidus]|uniref:uncharacterized protein LOC130515921 isoform X15 n=1 Tax=Takifugu flavidus TaxID=433684 RepID=UPI00254451BB|nr:uncharacterized protein LOC130515921 isoform X15 [Takifugu flavidus]